MSPFETMIAAALRPIAYVLFAWFGWLLVKALAKHAPSPLVRRWFQRVIDRATVSIEAASKRRQAQRQNR